LNKTPDFISHSLPQFNIQILLSKIEFSEFHFADGDQPPGAYLTDDGSHHHNHNGGAKTNSHSSNPPVLNTVSEVRAPNPETAGFFLDTALEAMSKEDPIRHFVFTLHVYQYTLDKNGKGGKSHGLVID
jgi:kinesin family protein 26